LLGVMVRRRERNFVFVRQLFLWSKAFIANDGV
jgi:hypothetical protein